jgi:hypothetical protein
MTNVDLFMLSDPSLVPDNDFIKSIVGEKMNHWDSIIAYMSDKYADSSGSWNYYKDGKQWLFKMVRKKKTIFWGGILQESFRITFYFGDKANALIESSDLPKNIKEGFVNAKRYGLIRPISLVVNEQADVENVLRLIAIKDKIK